MPDGKASRRRGCGRRPLAWCLLTIGLVFTKPNDLHGLNQKRNNEQKGDNNEKKIKYELDLAVGCAGRDLPDGKICFRAPRLEFIRREQDAEFHRCHPGVELFQSAWINTASGGRRKRKSLARRVGAAIADE